MKLTTFMMTLAALAMTADARGLSKVPDEKIILCINQYVESGKKCDKGECEDIWRKCHKYDANTNTYDWKLDRNAACLDRNNIQFFFRVYSCWKCTDVIMDTCMLEFFNITRSELELCTADPDECSRDPLRWDAVNKMQNSWGAEYIVNECDKNICPASKSGELGWGLCVHWCYSKCGYLEFGCRLGCVPECASITKNTS